MIHNFGVVRPPDLEFFSSVRAGPRECGKEGTRNSWPAGGSKWQVGR